MRVVCCDGGFCVFILYRVLLACRRMCMWCVLMDTHNLLESDLIRIVHFDELFCLRYQIFRLKRLRQFDIEASIVNAC